MFLFENDWGGDPFASSQHEPWFPKRGAIKRNVFCKRCAKTFGLEWRPTKYGKWWLWDREQNKWHECKGK